MGGKRMYGGNRDLTDLEERLAQERIDEQERLERLEKCVGIIKELVKELPTNQKEMEEVLLEIKFAVSSVD